MLILEGLHLFFFLTILHIATLLENVHHFVLILSVHLLVKIVLCLLFSNCRDEGKVVLFFPSV